MKHKLFFILLCLFISIAATLSAQTTTTHPRPAQQPADSGNIPSQALPPVPQNIPAGTQPGAPINVPQQTPPAVQQNVPANIQTQAPANTQPQPPVNVQPQISPGAQPQLPSSLTPSLPAGVTPEQVKAFLSKPKEENYIILNFDNADLRDVINTVGSITKESFIISPGVDARITINSAKKIPVSEVMNVFESVLEANGITLVKSGLFYKVVPGATAKQKPIEIRKGSEAEGIPDVDRIVTQIVAVDYVPVTEISAVLTPLLSQFGGIIPNPRNNLLIINDLSSNIKRLLTILSELDVNAFKNTRMLFFKPKYSDIATLTNELTEVLNALNITKDGLALVPIERINSLVIFSGSSSLLGAVEGWLKKLDEEITSGQNVFIYPVQNVKAEQVAEILNSLYGEGGGAKKISARQIDPQKRAAAQAQAQAAQPPVQTAAHQAGAAGGGGRVEIITFEPTNSLIILASPGTYREMVETIKKIDMYPREVLIEAIVAQVTRTDKDEMGVQWSVLRDIKINGSEFSGAISNRIDKLITEAPGLNSGAVGGLSLALFRPSDISVLINALAQRSKVNVLSSPRLLVRDQEEANIEVGSEIPTATSSTTSTESTTTTQSIQYKTVGIKLKIKPTISEEKTVVLDIEQEVSSAGDNVRIGSEGNTFPSFNTTKAKTSIIVPNENGIIIGGIMDETKDKGYQGIPLLSSIPILGGLFRYEKDTITKKELVIVIIPHVIVNKTEGEKVTVEFLDKLKEVKKYLNEKEIMVPAEKTNPAALIIPSKETQPARSQ